MSSLHSIETPIYIQNNGTKRKQIKCKRKEDNVQKKVAKEYSFILNTPPQARAYRSYAPSLLHIYLIGEGSLDKVCQRGSAREVPRRGSIGEGPTKRVRRRGSDGEGPPEKIRLRKSDGEDMTEKIQRRRSNGENQMEKIRWRRSDEEDSLDKVHQRRSVREDPSKKMTHLRTNHGSDTM